MAHRGATNCSQVNEGNSLAVLGASKHPTRTESHHGGILCACRGMRWFAEGRRFVSITESQLIRPLTGGDIIDDGQKPRATLGRHLGQNFDDAAINAVDLRTSLVIASRRADGCSGGLRGITRTHCLAIVCRDVALRMRATKQKGRWFQMQK